MTEEAIKELEEGFAAQGQYINRHPSDNTGAFLAELRDCIIMVAIVIRKLNPEYDIEKFYSNCGYVGDHPVHI